MVDIIMLCSQRFLNYSVNMRYARRLGFLSANDLQSIRVEFDRVVVFENYDSAEPAAAAENLSQSG